MEFRINRLRKNINRYFDGVPHRVLIEEDSHHHLIINVEYTDFLSEAHVMSSISRLAGEECELYVARECSEKIKKEVLATFSEPPHPIALYKRMAEYEIVQ